MKHLDIATGYAPARMHVSLPVAALFRASEGTNDVRRSTAGQPWLHPRPEKPGES